MASRARRHYQVFGLALLFLFSYLVFTYWTFPYGVLKEAIAAKVSQESGVTLVIDGLRPRFPLGFEAQGVRVSVAGNEQSLEIQQITARIGLFALITARVSASLQMKADNGGEFQLWSRLPILVALREPTPLPSRVTAYANRFPVDGFVDLGIASMIRSGAVSPLLVSVVEKLEVRGLLDVELDLSLNSSDLSQSQGAAELQLRNSFFSVNDPGLSISDQFFERSQITASLANGQVRITPGSGLESEELLLNIDGGVELRPDINQSQLDLEMHLELRGDLKDNFSIFIDPFLGGRDGVSRFQLRGPLANPGMVSI